MKKTTQDYYEDYVVSCINDLMNKLCSITDCKVKFQTQQFNLKRDEQELNDRFELSIQQLDKRYNAISKLIQTLQNLI